MFKPTGQTSMVNTRGRDYDELPLRTRVTMPGDAPATTSDQETPTLQYVMVQPERTIRRFYGTGEADLADEFVSEVKRTWALYPRQTDAWKYDTIVSNVGPVVKAELAVHDEVHGKPQETLEKILEVFGERRSPQRLTQIFYSLQQRNGESIRDYSHRVLSSFTSLTARQKAVKHEEAKQIVLKEHFVESLQDRVLTCTLRQHLKDNPDTTFRDLRDRAIQWCGDEAVASASHVGASQPDDSMALRMKSLEDMVMKLTSKIDDLQRPNPPYQSNQSNRNRGGPRLCYGCNKPGHYKRDCPGNVRPSPK